MGGAASNRGLQNKPGLANRAELTQTAPRPLAQTGAPVVNMMSTPAATAQQAISAAVPFVNPTAPPATPALTMVDKSAGQLPRKPDHRDGTAATPTSTRAEQHGAATSTANAPVAVVTSGAPSPAEASAVNVGHVNTADASVTDSSTRVAEATRTVGAAGATRADVDTSAVATAGIPSPADTGPVTVPPAVQTSAQTSVRTAAPPAAISTEDLINTQTVLSEEDFINVQRRVYEARVAARRSVLESNRAQILQQEEVMRRMAAEVEKLKANANREEISLRQAEERMRLFFELPMAFEIPDDHGSRVERHDEGVSFHAPRVSLFSNAAFYPLFVPPPCSDRIQCTTRDCFRTFVLRN